MQVTEAKKKVIKEEVKDIGLSAMSKERYELNDKLSAELAAVMNEIHGTNYSTRFWKMVIAPYVNAVISIQHHFETTEIKTNPRLTAINSFRPLSLKQFLKENMIRYAKFCLTFKYIFTNRKILRKENNVLLGFNGVEHLTKDLGVPLHNVNRLFFGDGNTKRRKIANAIAERYPDLFHKNFIRQVPKLYVEFFEQAMNAVPLFDPASKTIHLQVIASEMTEFTAAKYFEHGAKLYWYQHGACYGEFAGHNSHHKESSIADKFRSWGWKIKPNDEPWKAYRLEKFKLEYEQCKATAQFGLLLCYTMVYPANVNRIKELTDTFFDNIDAKKYKSFVARPRALNKIASHASALRFIEDKRVTVDSGLTNIAQLVKSSSLVIQFEVPGTNFLECVYVDHPVIGLLLNNQPTDAVKRHYEFLLEKGVLHFSFESIVQHLNKIDVQEWWQAVINDPRYQSFKREFANPV